MRDAGPLDHVVHPDAVEAALLELDRARLKQLAHRLPALRPQLTVPRGRAAAQRRPSLRPARGAARRAATAAAATGYLGGAAPVVGPAFLPPGGGALAVSASLGGAVSLGGTGVRGGVRAWLLTASGRSRRPPGGPADRAGPGLGGTPVCLLRHSRRVAAPGGVAVNTPVMHPLRCLNWPTMAPRLRSCCPRPSDNSKNCRVPALAWLPRRATAGLILTAVKGTTRRWDGSRPGRPCRPPPERHPSFTAGQGAQRTVGSL